MMGVAQAAGIALVVIVGVMTAVWAVSVVRRDASIADVCWGPGFAIVAWLYLGLFGAFEARGLLVASLTSIWGARLGWHIANRHRGEDPRYAAMRLAHGHAFWWRSLLIVFWLQALILWCVAAPLLAVARINQPALFSATDIVGLLVFLTGFAFEAIGDHQLRRFRNDPSRRGLVLDTGLWRYTRHPNYFGDALLWWGLYLVATSTSGGWVTVASPALMTLLLLRVSGVSLLESSLKASKPGYAEYVARTSAFVPWPPRRPRPLDS
jgi:steroid 5-alpha reductase family enzyme